MALSPVNQSSLKNLPLIAGSLFVLLVCAQPVFADSIRVLVAQEVTVLEVSSDGDLALVTEAGETRMFRSPVHISARSDGFHVDSRRVAGGQVVIRPFRNTLSLMMTQGSAIAHGPAVTNISFV